MPMIDVYAAAGTFADPKALARELATALMRVEQVPDIELFRRNTAAFLHQMPGNALSNVAGDPSLTERTWVLLTEAPDGGWGLGGHAYLNEELVTAARAELGRT